MNSWLTCPFEVYSRTLFQSRGQLLRKFVSAYTAALRKVASDCNFGTLDPTKKLYPNYTMLPLDVMLRDRFVCGLGDAHIQQRLLAEEFWSFTTAYDIVLRAEGAAKHQQNLKTHAGEVQQVTVYRKRAPPGRDAPLNAVGGATMFHTRRLLAVSAP